MKNRLPDYLQRHALACRWFQEIVDKKALQLTRGERTVRFNIEKERTKTLSDFAYKSLYRYRDSTVDLTEIYVIGRMLGNGPKVFQPRREDLDILEHMAINLEPADYAQPFNTMVFELPEDYLSRKTVQLPQAGQVIAGDLMPAEHRPVFCIVHYECQAILSTLIFSSDLSIKSIILPEANETFEQHLETHYNRAGEFPGGLETDEAEWQVSKLCLRACMNYCLLVDECGVKNRGPHNPSHYQRLQKKLHLNWQLRQHPIYFELSQEVKLYKSVQTAQELPEQSEATGRVMPPHNRRGHYRMQPHGPGATLRKRIRIPPVFVNAHLFFGDMANARATYTST